MIESARRTSLIVGAMVFTLLVLALALALALMKHRQLHRLPVLYAIPDFTLTNQQGQAVSRADLRGQVWVADIIFTRCAGPCPRMTQRMADLQAGLPVDAPVRLVSLTTDAEFDTPPVLLAYAQRYGAQPRRWHFLTGPKRQVANLAIDGFKFVASEKKPEERTDGADLFVHSTCFVVVDKQGRARAVFEYDQPEMLERALRAVRALLRER